MGPKSVDGTEVAPNSSMRDLHSMAIDSGWIWAATPLPNDCDFLMPALSCRRFCPLKRFRILRRSIRVIPCG